MAGHEGTSHTVVYAVRNRTPLRDRPESPNAADFKGEEAASPGQLRTHFFEGLANVAKSLAESAKGPKRKAALLAVAAAITAAIKGGAFGQ